MGVSLMKNNGIGDSLSKKSDMSLKQHGGEGKTLKAGGSYRLLQPKDKGYVAPGRQLG